MSPFDVGLVAENVVRRDGQGRVMLEMAKGLVRRGHRVRVYSSRLADEIHESVEWIKVSAAGGPQIVHDIAFARNARKATLRGNDDVLVVMGSCAILTGKPIVYFAAFSHAGWLKARKNAGLRTDIYRRAHGVIARWMEKRALSSVSVLVAINQQTVIDLGPLLPKGVNSYVVPGGVDIDEYAYVTDDSREQARKAVGLESETFAFGLIGEYATGRKGLDVLLETLKLRDDPSEVLLVHGEGPRASYMARIEAMGLSQRVLFPDPKMSVKTVMHACDVIAVPSIYETFSLVALEAAASGIPLVISSSAGALDVLAPRDAAISVDPLDEKQIRRALDSVRSDPSKYRTMSDRARIVAEELDWNRMGDAMVDLIEMSTAVEDAR